MTDNYQFDKNSKLFQKFLALKATKNNESFVDKPPVSDVPSGKSNENKNNFACSQQAMPKKERSISKQSYNFSGNGPLHVTVDDIEEAASVALNDSTLKHSSMLEKQENNADFADKTNMNMQSMEKDIYHSSSEVFAEKQMFSLKPKGERIREKRAREFKQKPKVKNETKEQNPIQGEKGPNFSSQGFQVSFKPYQPLIQHQTQNIEPNVVEQENAMKVEEANFTLGSKEGQYRKKYERMSQKYDQLKEILQQERKQMQTMKIEKESEVQILKEKYFQLRSIEDTLATDLKRYKERLQSENMMRTKFEEEVKELNFRIIELQQILEGKETDIKKKTDQIVYWKSQNQQLRSQLKQFSAQAQSFAQRSKFLQAESKIVQKDVSHKGLLVEELRKNIATLIEENNIAKDEIYKLTIKLYHLEQSNMSLKGDLMRKEMDHSHQMSVITDNYMKHIEPLSPKRAKERVEKFNNASEPSQPGIKEGGQRRRRQFARERAITKPQGQRGDKIVQRDQRRQRRTAETSGVMPTSDTSSREVAARIRFLQQQLEVRSKQKAMNGRLRKQKIEMQRELEDLLQRQQ